MTFRNTSPLEFGLGHPARQFGRRATNAEERGWDRAEYVRTLQPAGLEALCVSG